MSGPPGPIAEFPVRVTIRKVETGEVRSYDTTERFWDEEGAWSDFYWRDGNGSCDCNRQIIFEMAAGIEATGDEECGDGRFLIVSIVRTDTGACIYSEASP